MIVKALSLWEPWASMMRHGHKWIETRSWSTTYRGLLLICASKRYLRADHEELMFRCRRGGWTLSVGVHPGRAVALVDLVAVERAESLTTMRDGARRFRAFPGMLEHELGDYSPGRFGWCTVPIDTLFEPFPVAGKQGLFDVELPAELAARVGETIGG